MKTLCLAGLIATLAAGNAAAQPLPKEIDEAKFKQAVNAAFATPESLTAVFA